MRLYTSIKRARACLAAAVLVALGAGICAHAAAPPLLGQIAIRPLTPQDIKDYSLTGQQLASGLSTVGLGQPAHLEALINIGIAPSNIVSVLWTLTNQPLGSAAVLAASPLGANVPTYKMVDRLSHQVADRKVLRPDVAGDYKVAVRIETVGSGTVVLEQTITAGTYLGEYVCKMCHSGGEVAENKHTPWSKTGHATFLTRAIDGLASDHYGKNCISCHTLGYDANTNAVNGGFDDVAKQLGWTFPLVLTNGTWAAMPTALQHLSNIQCENCHGPGSQHYFNMGDVSKISVSMGAGDCAQCHDSKNTHVKNAEWNNSRHAIAVEETEAGCARCHSAKGFANFTSGAPATATPYEVITCAACHDPHSATNTHQLRLTASVALADNKTVITEGGTGLMCMNCHMSRRDATNYVEITAGSNRYGPHHGPQTDMLMGVNAMNYGKVIPSSAHKDVVEDSCATCHMQAVASTNAAFTKAGGHTFSMTAPAVGTNGPIHLVGACVECHGDIESFDFARQDYDGDGVMEGVQTEVKGLMAKLAFLLPPVGVPKDNISITSSWTRPQLRAGYNYLFVLEDGSYGVHNLSYAVGLLKASIADLSGDANDDGLPDWWQIQYFGSANSLSAAPNAAPAGDNIPNWLKYGLGLNPLTPGIVLPDGVIWANAGQVGGTNMTDKVQIFTAAEVVYNTEAGKTYQLQAISSLDGGWKNVGEPVVGDGKAVSLVTPTRSNLQQFYRVQITP